MAEAPKFWAGVVLCNDGVRPVRDRQLTPFGLILISYPVSMPQRLHGLL